MKTTTMTIKEFMNNGEVEVLTEQEQQAYDMLSLTLKYVLIFIIGAKFFPHSPDFLGSQINSYIYQFTGNAIEAFKVR
jgi:hypothetical protein